MAFFLSLRDGVTLERLDDGSLVFGDETRSATLKGLSEETHSAFRSISAGGEEEEILTAAITRKDGPLALAKFRYYLRSMDQLGWLVRSSRLDGKTLATLSPIAPGFQFSSTD